jgi:hypothetical protein
MMAHVAPRQSQSIRRHTLSLRTCTVAISSQQLAGILHTLYGCKTWHGPHSVIASWLKESMHRFLLDQVVPPYSSLSTVHLHIRPHNYELCLLWMPFLQPPNALLCILLTEPTVQNDIAFVMWQCTHHEVTAITAKVSIWPVLIVMLCLHLTSKKQSKNDNLRPLSKIYIIEQPMPKCQGIPKVLQPGGEGG